MAQANAILQKDGPNKKGILLPVGRTLPREIVKWIQGLDLSYSVKDPRRLHNLHKNFRDLGNGFLIAEIFSRYFPGSVQMHSFDNSHNTSRIKNNWEQLNLFFLRNDLPYGKESYQKIVQDNDWDQLYTFVTSIYMRLTERKVQNPPLATFVNSKEYYSSSITDGGTQSFLLKDKGLERLDNPKEDKQVGGEVAGEIKEQNSEKQAQLSVSSKRTNFLRVPSKPISQNVENLNYQIDVKNIQIRPVQGNIMKVREQQLAQSQENDLSHQFPQKIQSNGLQESFQKSIQDTQTDKRDGTGPKDKQLEKTIYQILNETLMMRMQSPQFLEDMKKFKVKNNTLVQAFIDQIEVFSDEFSGGFFQDIIQQKEAFINFIFKDMNDLWKFFNFTFQCLENLPVDRDAFKICIELVHQFGQKALQKEANKTRFIFTEFFLPSICQLIKNCILFEKKEMIIQIIYSFCPPDPLIRHQVIASLKDNMTSIGLFMQTLTVLIKFETVYSENQKQLFQDYINYAQIHLFSQSPALSSCALSIFAHIAEVNPSFVHARLYSKVGQISRNKWWQNRCLAIVLYSSLIKGVIAGPSYQTLIKSPQSGQKFFSMDNDRMISDLKNQVAHFANGIQIASQPASSDMLISTTLIYIVDLLGDSPILLDLFVQVMLEVGHELRQWVLYGGLEDVDGIVDGENSVQTQDHFMFVVPSDKSFKYKTNINSKIIQQFAPKILVNLVDKLKVSKPPLLSAGQFQILHYCFQFTDFKVMNMESCEQVAKLTKEYIYLGMCDTELCVEAAELVHKLLDLQYKAEVNITEQEQLFCQCLTLIIRGESQRCFDNLMKFLDILTEEALLSGNEGLKSFMKGVHQNMMEMQPSPLQNQYIAKAFEKIASPNDDSHFSPTGFGSPQNQAPNNNIPSQIDEDMEISAVDRQQDEYLEEGALEDAEFDEEDQDEVLDVQD